MAEKHDRYKESKDYIMIDKGGYKTRKFLTAKEKAERAKPKAEAAKPAAKAKATSTKAKSSKSEPMSKSKVPMTREKRAERKKIVRDTREIIDRTSPARSVKGKVKKKALDQAPYSDQAKRDDKRKKEPMAAKIYDKTYGNDKWKPK